MVGNRIFRKNSCGLARVDLGGRKRPLGRQNILTTRLTTSHQCHWFHWFPSVLSMVIIGFSGYYRHYNCCNLDSGTSAARREGSSPFLGIANAEATERWPLCFSSQERTRMARRAEREATEGCRRRKGRRMRPTASGPGRLTSQGCEVTKPESFPGQITPSSGRSYFLVRSFKIGKVFR